MLYALKESITSFIRCQSYRVGEVPEIEKKNLKKHGNY